MCHLNARRPTISLLLGLAVEDCDSAQGLHVTANHEKAYISNPATKNKSVWLSDEGARLSEELFEKLFALK